MSDVCRTCTSYTFRVSSKTNQSPGTSQDSGGFSCTSNWIRTSVLQSRSLIGDSVLHHHIKAAHSLGSGGEKNAPLKNLQALALHNIGPEMIAMRSKVSVIVSGQIEELCLVGRFFCKFVEIICNSVETGKTR